MFAIVLTCAYRFLPLTIKAMMRQPKMQRETDFEVVRFLSSLESERQKRNGLPYARINRVLQLLKSIDNDQDQCELELSLGALDSFFERYQWTVRVWRPALASRGNLSLTYSPTHRELSTDGDWEHRAVGRVLKLAGEQSTWARVQQCQNPDCMRWYLSEKVQHGAAFCKGSCRQKVHASDPVRRAKKNEKARETYQSIAAKNRKIDDAAGVPRPAQKKSAS